MTPQEIIRGVTDARQQGTQVAIELHREGFWVQPDDVLEEREGLLYWEHVTGTTFLIPAGIAYLKFRPADPA